MKRGSFENGDRNGDARPHGTLGDPPGIILRVPCLVWCNDLTVRLHPQLLRVCDWQALENCLGEEVKRAGSEREVTADTGSTWGYWSGDEGDD